MNPEDIEDMEYQVGDAKLQNEQMQQLQQAKLLEEQSSGMIKEQLNLDEEFENMTYLLKGYTEEIKDGEKVWIGPDNNDEVLLTKEGVNFVLKIMRWYLNKNTLLSNYDTDTINAKMEDFSISLADALFMSYEKYFLYPTAEECEKKLIERLEKKQRDILSSARIQRIEKDKEEVWKKLIDEINPSVEKEKIKEQIIKNKLKLYDLLMRQIQDSVHSTYLRAWNGQERRTLRQHHHISETKNPGTQQTKGESGGFFKRR